MRRGKSRSGCGFALTTRWPALILPPMGERSRYGVLGAACVLWAAVVLGLGVGCKAGPAAITSPWPVARSERKVPKPPEPPRWPLTGESAASAEAVRVRVVSIKIENGPEARPQTGLQMADVVYETVTEGGVTRFNAIFHSRNPAKVGSVRSARLSDTYVVPQYKALFAFSGASTFVNGRIARTSIENLSEDAGVTRPYVRSRDKPRPHNLYTGVDAMRAEGKRRGFPTAQDLRSFAFERRRVEATPTVTQISIPFSQANKVAWTYDPKARVYLRVNNGKMHTDAATGRQISARNVVVMWARIRGSGHSDSTGSETYDITLSGTNRVSVFRDGQRYDGIWSADRTSPPQFKGEDGKLIKLGVGNTWIQVIATDVNISMK